MGGVDRITRRFDFFLAITSLPDTAVTIGIERGGENGRRYEWNFVWIRLKVE